MKGDIVVGVGGAGSGFAAARTAGRVASALGVQVVLVFGYEPSQLAPRGGVFEERIAEIGDEAIAQIQSELTSLYPSLSIEVRMVQQRPADALIAIAEEHEAGAIAVGHGGQGPLRGALLGNITYEIVHRSPIAVLVVPDEDEDQITS